VIYDAVVPAEDVNGGSWDVPGGLPDPYVVVAAGSSNAQGYVTSTILNNLLPTWNEIVLSGVKASALKSYIGIAVYDYDDVSSNELIGACEWKLPDSEFFSDFISFDCPSGGDQAGFSLRFYVMPHQ
jgi:Ca2+-dependent lipid-binding protein